jgi:SAM-dependent methyltransferase
MPSPNQQSLTPEFFKALYEADPDPWKFATSEYEARKYAVTLSALTKPTYSSALEIGGSIGILTEQLGERCESLLSIDVSEIAQAQAAARCLHLPQVQFQIMTVPQEFPDQSFDLILVSEVAYYWSLEDWAKAQDLIFDHLNPGGQLLLVHWTVDAQEMPLTGDQVHDALLGRLPNFMRHCDHYRDEKYRLDLFERV